MVAVMVAGWVERLVALREDMMAEKLADVMA